MRDLETKAALIAVAVGLVIAVIVYFVISAVIKFVVIGLCVGVVAFLAALIYRRIKS